MSEWKAIKKNRTEITSLLAMEEESSFEKIDGMVTHLWKDFFHHCSLLPQTKTH